jgi:glycosyltransferase involved in cell wall biosynthesis
VVTIYNPIEVAGFANVSSADVADARRALAIPADALVIGLVGQVQPIKGHAEFVTAALDVARQLPRAHFLLVGDPPPDAGAERFAAEIRHRVQHSSCADRFHFVGFRSDIQPLMGAIDILVVPSWNEPFGRVAVEGMAAGCAVVGTQAGGLPEIIADEVDGLLVPPRDPSALAAAVLRLCQQPELRLRLGERGRQTADRFGVAQHVQAIEALYETVLAQARKTT